MHYLSLISIHILNPMANPVSLFPSAVRHASECVSSMTGQEELSLCAYPNGPPERTATLYRVRNFVCVYQVRKWKLGFLVSWRRSSRSLTVTVLSSPPFPSKGTHAWSWSAACLQGWTTPGAEGHSKQVHMGWVSSPLPMWSDSHPKEGCSYALSPFPFPSVFSFLLEASQVDLQM